MESLIEGVKSFAPLWCCGSVCMSLCVDAASPGENYPTNDLSGHTHLQWGKQGHPGWPHASQISSQSPALSLHHLPVYNTTTQHSKEFLFEKLLVICIY